MASYKDKFKQEFDLVENVLIFANDLIAVKVNDGSIVTDKEYKLPPLYLYASFLKTAKAIIILCGEGFASPAGSLIRSLAEHVANFNFIHKSPEKNGLLFQRFAYVEKGKGFKLLRKYAPQLQSEEDDWTKDEVISIENIKRINEEILKLDPRYDKNKQEDYDTSNKWSGLSMKEMHKELNASHEYETNYSIFSGFVHPNPYYVSGIMEEFNDVVKSSPLKPSDKDIKSFIMSTGRSLLIMVYLANGFYHLNKINQIEQYIKDYEALSESRLFKL